MFHRSYRSDCDVEPFFEIIGCCFRTVNSDLTLLGLRDSEFKFKNVRFQDPFCFSYELEVPRLQVEMLRF